MSMLLCLQTAFNMLIFNNAVFSASNMDELETQLYTANNRTYNVLPATGAYSLGSQTVLSNGSILHISTIDDDFDGDYLSIHLMAMTMGIQFQTQTTIARRAVCLIL